MPTLHVFLSVAHFTTQTTKNVYRVCKQVCHIHWKAVLFFIEKTMSLKKIIPI